VIALDPPHDMTTHVETKPLAITIVGNLVFNLRARDWLIARDAYVAKSITGETLRPVVAIRWA
jgi:hypothetical protein